MRTYELVLVFNPALEVEQIDLDLRKISDLLGGAGNVRRWERWGKRRLAYEIAGNQYGYYVLSVFDAEPKTVTEVDRAVRINAAVIRHLVTQVDPKRVPEPDPESVRTLGAAPGTAAPTPVVEAASEEADVPVGGGAEGGAEADQGAAPATTEP